MPRMQQYWGVSLLIPLFVLAGCVYDPDDPCGEGLELKDSVCVCQPNHIPEEVGRCIPCGEFEQAFSDTCECIEGYLRNSEGVCVVSKQGKPCSATEPCDDTIFTYCHLLDGGNVGYCTTQGCSSNNDCLGKYTCETRVSPQYCMRPATGLGKACDGPDGCAQYEAWSCDYFFAHTCQVAACDLDDILDCPRGYACCSWPKLVGNTYLSAGGTRGIPTNYCYPESAINDNVDLGAECGAVNK